MTQFKSEILQYEENFRILNKFVPGNHESITRERSITRSLPAVHHVRNSETMCGSRSGNLIMRITMMIIMEPPRDRCISKMSRKSPVS